MKRLLAFLLFSTMAFAQGSQYRDTVIDQYGKPVSNATVTVCVAAGCPTKASIYSDEALSQVKANPFLTDSLSNFSFYATNGSYTIQVSKNSSTLSTYVVTLPGGAGGSVNGQAIAPKSVNSVRYANQYDGADAGAKIAAAIADLPSTGGTVDARGLVGNQTVSSTVAVGTASKPVTLILDHATTYIPASAALDMFSIGPNGKVDGLSADVSGVTYTGKAVKFVGAFSDGMRGSLENFLIVGGGTGGTAVALVSSSSNQIVFVGVRHGRIVGFGKGLDLDAQGTSMYVNANIFDDVEIKDAVVAIRLNAATGLQTSGNQFSNINLQYGPDCTDAIVGSGLGEISDNMFVNTNIWDYALATSINFASTAIRNYFIGRADGIPSDSGSQNTIINVRGNGGIIQWLVGASHGLKLTTDDGYGWNFQVGATEWKIVQSGGALQFIKTGVGTPITSEGIDVTFERDINVTRDVIASKGTFSGGVVPADLTGCTGATTDKLLLDSNKKIICGTDNAAAGAPGGGSIPNTTLVLKGDNAGNAVAATAGTDYVIPAGNVATATALAANPADCSAGQYANAINASGALTCAQALFSELGGSVTDAQVPNNITINLAATATALAANGANCSAGQAPLGVDASGAVEGCWTPIAITVADTQVLFADGANTPAGDAGLTYNKTTDALTAGSFQTSGASLHGESATSGVATELITLSTSGTITDSTANLLPATSIIEAVVCRVTTSITTATNWAIGDATTSARFCSPSSTMTAGTSGVCLNHQKGSVATDAAGRTQTAAAKLRITTTGTPGAGAIRCTVFYQSFTAPTS